MLTIKKCLKCGALVEVLHDCTCENCGVQCCGEEMRTLLPNTVDAAAKDYDPAKITRYTQDLATLFHKFYDKCRIKGAEENLLYARLSLCEAVKITLRNTLDMLKITCPEKM